MTHIPPRHSPPAETDDMPSGPLITRVVTSGPNLGRVTIIEAKFIPAADCEWECDRAFALFRSTERRAGEGRRSA